jgi:Fe-S-cluster-containing dehydrogenase component
MKQITYVPNRCVGCEECVVSCEKAHDWETRAYVEIIDGYFPFPMRCNHCGDAPCKAACPAGAITRTGSGAVVVDQVKCIGCGTCITVCPFGVPRLSDRNHKAVKCDGCYERVEAGQEPVCVVSCPKLALAFVEADEPLRGRRQRVATLVKTSLGL